MNERIKELLVEAREQTREGKWHAPTAVWAEKFAELIVRECADQIVSQGKDWIDFAPSQIGIRPEYWKMAQHIKQHFGVKE